MTDKKYIFSQDELEGFLAFAFVEGMEHPNMSLKSLIKLLYKKDSQRRRRDEN